MNLIASYLTKEKIRKAADDVRRKNSYISEEIPVPVENIIQRIGIEIRPLNKIKEKFDVEGFLSKDCKIIFVDNECYQNVNLQHRVRFTLAHELGHYILHREFLENLKFDSIDEWNNFISDLDDTKLGWFEWQANEFAGRFLVPITTLVEEIDKDQMNLNHAAISYGIEDEDITDFLINNFANRLASRFLVSSEVLEFRIKNEKLEHLFIKSDPELLV